MVITIHMLMPSQVTLAMMLHTELSMPIIECVKVAVSFRPLNHNRAGK